MNVLENSFNSQRDSPTRAKSHSLCQDLIQLGAKPEIQQLSSSKPQIQSEQNDNSFLSPNDNNKLQNQPSIDLENNNTQQIKSKQFQPNENQINLITDTEPTQQKHIENQQDISQDNSSPKTITLIEQNIGSKQLSLNMSSKISQYSMEVDNQSFATFLSIRDTSYNSLIKNFQLLFQNVSNLFTQRIKNISQTYLTFIRVKYNQQKSYLSTNLGHTQNNRNHIIYINCKTISQQIRNKVQQQTQKRTQYIKTLQQLTNKLQKHFQTTFVTLQTKKQKIKQIHTKLLQIVKQMSDLMIPQIRKKQKNVIDKKIYTSSFLRTKYLMSKQKSYLALIAMYLQKVLNFISVVCLDIEPNTCLIVKQSMLGYIQALSTFNPQSKIILQKQVKALQKTHCFNQTFEQVAKLLQLCLPDSICPYNITQSNQNPQKKLKKIIQYLISQSQSLVYIPVIQLQPKDYAYHSKNKAKVKWIKINQNSKKSQQQIQQRQTYVIITHQGQLILQLIDQNKKSEQKMAILKLKNIKFSRKNNLIYLTDRGTGMLGYLLSSNILIGTLCFQGLTKSGGNIQNQAMLIQEFIERVKDVLELEKQNKDRNKNK